MSHELLAVRQGLIDKRDQFNAAIAPLDALIGTPEAPPRQPAVVSMGTKKKPRVAKAESSKVTQRASPQTSEVVQARDASILKALRQGPAEKAALIEAMPPEPGKTPQHRSGDCANALTRLKLKKLIKQVDDGWALV